MADTEALARVLDPWAFESARRHSARAVATATATRILRDPGPLLDALPDDVLVEALVRRGVLRQEWSTVVGFTGRRGPETLEPLDHLADLDQQRRSLRDRAEWLRGMAKQADDAAAIRATQRENFAAMIAAPRKVLDMRPGSMQAGGPDA